MDDGQFAPRFTEIDGVRLRHGPEGLTIGGLVATIKRLEAEVAELRRRLDEERLDKAKFLIGAEGIR